MIISFSIAGALVVVPVFRIIQSSPVLTVFCSEAQKENIAKGTTDPRVEFISQVIKQILLKQFQNFD